MPRKKAPFAGQALPTEVVMAGYRDELRKRRAIITDWQKFAARLSKLLKCGTMTDDIELAVKKLTGNVKLCSRCNGNGTIWHVPPEPKPMGTVTCPKCKGSGIAKKGT